ncbi:Hypothetical protein SMAX5B_016311 [Scophthalmus maximus]|uniref:Uncharacterized protein n=1 Tax=Scophthalmus maximus TaxID=52904 RepID=A0A2U9BL71_SCOMX|nr:Hypothetical protein SMAX5B_016311 [Scophthalmus maximus]KAF0047561.1 hypothetical protein F2P81_001194 [Scophthalmus maximus]
MTAALRTDDAAMTVVFKTSVAHLRLRESPHQTRPKHKTAEPEQFPPFLNSFHYAYQHLYEQEEKRVKVPDWNQQKYHR